MKESSLKSIKDLPSTHVLGPGTSACAGCGALGAIKIFCDILGEKTVFVNAAGCMTLLTIYPFTPFKGSWIYTAMASAPAGAQGIRDALDLLIRKGRLKPEEDLKVVVLTGDGAAYGMGLSLHLRSIGAWILFISAMITRDMEIPDINFQPLLLMQHEQLPVKGQRVTRDIKRTCLLSGLPTGLLMWLLWQVPNLWIWHAKLKKQRISRGPNYS